MSPGRLAAALATLATAACSPGHFDDLRDRAWVDPSDQPDGIDGADYPIAIASLTTDRPGLHVVAVAARPPGLATVSYDISGSLEYRGVAITEVSGAALDTTRATVTAATAPVTGADGPVVVGGLGDRKALLIYDARSAVLGPELRRVIEGSSCGAGTTDLGRHMVWTLTNLGSANDPDLIVSSGGDLLAFIDVTPDDPTPDCVRCAVQVGGAPRTIQSMVAADFDPTTPGDEIAMGVADPDQLQAGSVEIFHASLIELHDTMAAACFTRQSNMAHIPAESPSELDFGAALATGNSNGNTLPELAMAVPAESRVYIAPDMGTSGPSAPLLTIIGTATSESFAATLAFGDLDQDGRDELIIGAPGTDVEATPRAGSLWLYGSDGIPGPPSYELAAHLTLARPEPDQRLGQAIVVAEFVGSADDTDLLLAGANGELFTFFRALAASTDPRE